MFSNFPICSHLSNLALEVSYMIKERHNVRNLIGYTILRLNDQVNL
jgi:hypothetical protein